MQKLTIVVILTVDFRHSWKLWLEMMSKTVEKESELLVKQLTMLWTNARTSRTGQNNGKSLMQWGTSQEIESGRKWGKKCKLQLPARSCLAKWVNGDEAAAGSCWRKGASTTQQEKKGYQIDVGAWEKWEQNVEKKYSLLFCCRQNGSGDEDIWFRL